MSELEEGGRRRFIVLLMTAPRKQTGPSSLSDEWATGPVYNVQLELRRILKAAKVSVQREAWLLFFISFHQRQRGSWRSHTPVRQGGHSPIGDACLIGRVILVQWLALARFHNHCKARKRQIKNVSLRNYNPPSLHMSDCQNVFLSTSSNSQTVSITTRNLFLSHMTQISIRNRIPSISTSFPIKEVCLSGPLSPLSPIRPSYPVSRPHDPVSRHPYDREVFDPSTSPS